MNITSIKYDGQRVVLKYENELGDLCSLEAPCERERFERLLSNLAGSVSEAAPKWQITVNVEKSVVRETVKRTGMLTLSVLQDLLAEAMAFVTARRKQLDLFNAIEPEGVKITDIRMSAGVPA
jgi:hypothetical protein